MHASGLICISWPKHSRFPSISFSTQAIAVRNAICFRYELVRFPKWLRFFLLLLLQCFVYTHIIPFYMCIAITLPLFFSLTLHLDAQHRLTNDFLIFLLYFSDRSCFSSFLLSLLSIQSILLRIPLSYFSSIYYANSYLNA